jgi:hypothetical protein
MQQVENPQLFNSGNGPKYPFVKVQVSGSGGFQPTVAAVQAAMTRAGIPEPELSNFYEEAAEGDEDNLLRPA